MDTTSWKTILAILPPELRRAVGALPPEMAIEELRLRVGIGCSVLSFGKETVLCCNNAPLPITSAQLQQLISAAAHQSLYTVENTIPSGYLILPGGYRLGLCGTAVMRNGIVQTFRDLSSVSIRFSRQVRGCADILLPELKRGNSVLLIGPPGAGKTTVLRDAVRQLSDKLENRVGLCDERGEIAAMCGGAPQFEIGKRTDVLAGCPKAEAMEILIRTMNPQWIAVDEITKAEDVTALMRASYCGVRFLATAHAEQWKDLFLRPIYRQLMQLQLFSKVAVLLPHRRLQLRSGRELYDTFDRGRSAGNCSSRAGNFAGVPDDDTIPGAAADGCGTECNAG